MLKFKTLTLLFIASLLLILPVISSGAVISYVYDDFHRLKQIENHSNGNVTTYYYDEVGNRTRKIVTSPGSPPTAEFSATPSSGVAPLTVNFNDQSTGSITSWSWDFGDGGTSASQNPSHTYVNAGTYTVSLTASGPNGSDTEIKPNFITVSSSSCTYDLSSYQQTFGASGGTGSVNVTAGSGCAWTATSNNPDWISTTSGSSGTGNGTVTYSVSENTGLNSRIGTISIAGKTFTVNQVNSYGTESQVNTYTINNQSYPSVAMNGNGIFVVAWQSYAQDGSMDGIYAQRYDSVGNAMGSEFKVNTYTTNYQSRPSIAIDVNGNFVIAWQSSGQDGSSYGIYAQRYDSVGTPVGAEFKVNTYTTSDQYFPSVAMDANGNFVVTWQSYNQDGSNDGIYAQRYSSAGAPMGSEFRVNTYTTSVQYFPSVAMDSSSNFVIAWQSNGQDGSYFGIYAQRYNSAGTPLGSEFRVNTYTTGDQQNPSVAMDSTGNFVIVWQSGGQDGSNDGIYAQRYNSAGTPLGSEFRINSYIEGNQRDPSVAMNANGNFVISWESYGQDGNGWGIYAQGYDSAGTPMGSEFKVNSYTMDDQLYSSVGMDADGNFVVAWQSNGQDGDGFGIFMNRFFEIPDTVPPVTTASPIGGTYTSAQSVTLTCDDGSGSGCAGTKYCLGTGCTPTIPYAATINIASSITLRFYSTDNTGNSESVKTEDYTINIDTVAPTTTASPIGGTYTSAQGVTLTCDDGTGSGCAGTIYCLGAGCTPIIPYTEAINIASSDILRFYSTDNAGINESVKTETYTIQIIEPLTITTSSLPSGSPGVAYSQTLTATGGVPPYTWAISSGNLPNGLTLNSSTGIISGTPSASGTFDFTVQVTDTNLSTAYKNLSISIQSSNSLARIQGTSQYFSDIQSAYDACVDGNIVQIQAGGFYQDIYLDRDVAVSLIGGYTSDFSPTDSCTQIHGVMTLTNGTVVMDNICIP